MILLITLQISLALFSLFSPDNDNDDDDDLRNKLVSTGKLSWMANLLSEVLLSVSLHCQTANHPLESN